jgi:hypothetical protein
MGGYVLDLDKYMMDRYGLVMNDITELTFHAPLDSALVCIIYRGDKKVGEESHPDVAQALAKWWQGRKDLMSKSIRDAVGSQNLGACGDVEKEISDIEERLYTINYRRFTA